MRGILVIWVGHTHVVHHVAVSLAADHVHLPASVSELVPERFAESGCVSHDLVPGSFFTYPLPEVEPCPHTIEAPRDRMRSGGDRPCRRVRESETLKRASSSSKSSMENGAAWTLLNQVANVQKTARRQNLLGGYILKWLSEASW